MPMRYNTVGVGLRTLKCRLFGKTDTDRWRDVSTFGDDWKERTRLIAKFIPDHARVIEFGAGSRGLQVISPARLHLHTLRFG